MEELNRIYVPIIECPIHKLPVSKACSDLICRKRALMCGKCEDQHDHLTSDLPNFCKQFTKQVDIHASNNRQQCKQFLSNKDNMDIFKAMHNQAQHIQKFTDNINTQKIAIAFDFTRLNEELMMECQKAKDYLFAQLDQMSNNYIEAFKAFQKSFQSGFSLATDYYFSNLCCFNNKLAQQGDKANDFVGFIKQSCDFTKQLEELQMISAFVTSVPFHAPLYSQNPDLTALISQCSETIKTFFMVKLKTPTASFSPTKRQQVERPVPNSGPPQIFMQRNVSKPSVSVQSGGGSVKMLDPSSNSLNFKPLKKYQLDFSVSSLLSLTHSLFVLSSSSDNKIHLFDRESKKATVYDAHELSANILEKLDSPRADSYPFVSAGQDGSIIVWQTYSKSISQIKRYNCGVKPIQSVLDMQNGGGFVFVDCDGRIGYCNSFTGEDVYPTSGRVQGRVTRLTLIKANETFITYVPGQESGLYWKMTDIGGRRDFKVLLSVTLPTAPSIVSMPLAANHCLLVSCVGVTPLDLDSRIIEREGRQGPEVETITFEFDNLLFLLIVPIAYGLPQLFKIEKRGLRQFEVKGNETKLEAISSLEITYIISQKNNSGKPKMRVFKEEDKVYLIIAKQAELLIYEVQKI